MKKERLLEIYCGMYFMICSIGLDSLERQYTGFCSFLFWEVSIFQIDPNEENAVVNELKKYRTQNGAWHHKVGDWKIRTKVLLKAIKDLETHPSKSRVEKTGI